ncbi:MAG: endonuclease/exonuclease/phosphatase family protein [Rhodocyclaceae bacterium]|nr:endonuclease/exonuclease/phosphatase family protein [Rhodocyclaceae bacterium]
MLTIATWNIHKGLSQFNRRLTVHELRERLRQIDADIVFLQEVQGAHAGHAARHENWPQVPQHEFLAEGVWPNHAYGRNVAHDLGHHGNAILSRFPILQSRRHDITRLRFEKRGLLFCEIDVPGISRPLACICAHLSLFGRSRRRQYEMLARFIAENVDPESPLVVAGDFNDWGGVAQRAFAPHLGLVEVFAHQMAKPTKSFPAALPMLRLDRIYVRGLAPLSCTVHSGPAWAALSDHAALSARIGMLTS